MWPFGSKHKTLSHAVLSGDFRTAKRMLAKGADPNKCDPGDSAWPIHYGVNHGPEMVQLLLDHGADPNISARGHNPLDSAEMLGHQDVAAVLRKAGAKLSDADEELWLDPHSRLKLKPAIESYAFMARMHFPADSPEQIAERVQGKINIEFPPGTAPQEMEQKHGEVRALILKGCGVKNYRDALSGVPDTPEQLMKKTGLTEQELTRKFMENLIEQGKNPFDEMPAQMIRESEIEYPDLVAKAHRKFGKP